VNWGWKSDANIDLGGTSMFGHKLWPRLGAHFPDTRATIRDRRVDYRRFGISDAPRVIENVDVTSIRECLLTKLHISDHPAIDILVNT
jgi:hypothetical protein